VKLTGEGGLLQQLTKRVLESALEGELTDHLGHEPGERAEGGRENYRNGRRSKTEFRTAANWKNTSFSPTDTVSGTRTTWQPSTTQWHKTPLGSNSEQPSTKRSTR